MNELPQTVIESIGIYLPPDTISTEDTILGCARNVVLPLEVITGIKTRHVTNGLEFSIDLARKAVEKCLAKSRYSPDEIDLVIACNICRYDRPNLQFSFEPNTSFQLSSEFGFSNATSFDVSNACTGLFTGIYVASAFINAGVVRHALIVSEEYVSHMSET